MPKNNITENFGTKLEGNVPVKYFVTACLALSMEVLLVITPECF